MTCGHGRTLRELTVSDHPDQRRASPTAEPCLRLFSAFVDFLVFVFIFLHDRVSLCSPGCPETCSVDQAGLELTEIRLPLPPSAGIKGVHHHHQNKQIFLKQ